MRRYRTANGEVTLSNILMLAVVAFVIYEATRFGPVLFAQYQFNDIVVEETKFSRGKKAETIRDVLVQRAAELGLPVTAQNIKVMREPTRTRILVNYRLSVEWLPGQIYSWDVGIDEQSVLF